MRFGYFATAVLLALCVVCSVAVMAFEKPKPKECMKVCTADYDPVCAGVQGAKDKPISFGSVCVLNNYNCENGKDLSVLSKGQCEGSTSVRVS